MCVVRGRAILSPKLGRRFYTRSLAEELSVRTCMLYAHRKHTIYANLKPGPLIGSKAPARWGHVAGILGSHFLSPARPETPALN